MTLAVEAFCRVQQPQTQKNLAHVHWRCSFILDAGVIGKYNKRLKENCWFCDVVDPMGMTFGRLEHPSLLAVLSLNEHHYHH